MAIRYPAGDWVKQVDGYGGYALGTATNQAIILNQTLVFAGPYVDDGVEEGARVLHGISIKDGSFVKDIDVVNIGGRHFTNGDLAVDQNGYIWTLGAASGVNRPAAQVINPINSTIIASIGLIGANYGGSFQIFDPINNVMWQYKNTTTLQALSTVSYTETTTIADRADGGIAVDYDKNEVWVFNTTANTIKRYNATTGALLSTITSSFTLNGTRTRYIPEKKWVIVHTQQNAEIWSTETYTQVRAFVIASGTDGARPNHYHPGIDALIGELDVPSTGFSHLKAYAQYSPYDTDIYTLNLLNPTDPFGNDQLVHMAITIDSDGNIYFGVDNFNTGAKYFYKIAYTVGTDGGATVLGTGTSIGDAGLFTDIPDIFNRELIFDLDLAAFYVHDLGHTGLPGVVDYVQLPGFAIGTADETIMAGNDVVLVTSGDTVIIDGFTTIDRTTEPRGEHFKYVTLSGSNFTLSEYRDFSFKDFVSFNGVGDFFDSYIVTGYDISQDMMRKKRSIYLLMYNERTETIYTLDSNGDVVLARQSGCLIQPQWDWNTSMAQGKWGQTFQAYRFLNNRNQPTSPASGDAFDYGERVIITKNKLRGSGRALSILIRNEDGKDMKLLGWALDITKQDIE